MAWNLPQVPLWFNSNDFIWHQPDIKHKGQHPCCRRQASHPRSAPGNCMARRARAGPEFKFATTGPELRRPQATPGPPHPSWSPHAAFFGGPKSGQRVPLQSCSFLSGRQEAGTGKWPGEVTLSLEHPGHSPGGRESCSGTGRAGILGTTLAWAWGGRRGQLWPRPPEPLEPGAPWSWGLGH